ncbi:MAG: putative sulfate exporter family transporter, partial [Coprobacter sp.]|nr:putative sulfate exporter family transporter [Coprobacter sp.]
GVMILGAFLGKLLKINRKNSYLISSGTAICGGSAIAAVAPVIDADENDTSLALITIFVLNAVALFIFPPIGRALDLSQVQFGTWAAIAIHDTSSVVGAGAAYGDEALKVATTIKLTRALWIIPLAFVSAFVFRTKGRKASIPYFIIWFVVAMLVNTYFTLPQIVTANIVFIAKKLLTVTLFLIGCGLSISALKTVGVKPLLLGVILWIIISVVTLLVVML